MVRPMARKHPEFQPSLILLDVLSGAFRTRGTTLEGWCKDNGYSGMNARGAALGVSKSEAAKKLLETMIDAAGRDFVLKVYRVPAKGRPAAHDAGYRPQGAGHGGERLHLRAAPPWR